MVLIRGGSGLHFFYAVNLWACFVRYAKDKTKYDMNEQKDTGLRWLSVQAIHDHCHIDFNCEDAELEQFGIAAEQAILNLTRRTFENFIDTYGRIPDPIFNASLLLVQSLYKNRDAEEQLK